MQETPQQYMKRIRGYVAGRKPVRMLSAAPKRIAALLEGVPKGRLTRRPSPGAWSACEILAHLADVEVVQSFRFRLILESSGAPLQSFDQDQWAKFSNYGAHDPALSYEAYRANRERNVRLLASLPPGMWSRYGMHAERGRETIRRIAEMLAGHDLNHESQIRRALK